MNRPARKLSHLTEKIASKTSRNHKAKPGKRLKRWKKWAEAYKAVASAE